MSSRPVAFSAERLLHILQSLPTVNAYVVAYSGGADSTALLHALNSLEDKLATPVSAIHINHGLHADADLWQSQCENFCQLNNIELTCLSIDLQNKSGKGLEAEAREQRYQAMTDLLEPGSCLLTAHHADDQAETLMLNLMRGSGVDGLSAMPVSRPLAHALLQRPLLSFLNSSLKDYLRNNDTEWVEDPSNQQLDHDRNFVRHEVIPLLEQRWPEVSKRLLLTSKAMSDTRALLEGLADSYLETNLSHPFVLDLSQQVNSNQELLKLVIRRWIKQLDLAAIGVYQLATFCQQALQAGPDHNVTVAWGGCELRLYKHQLWLLNQPQIVPCPTLVWPQDSNSVELGPDIGQLIMEGSHSNGPGAGLTVGARNNMNESAIDQGLQHKSLKNLFQAADIPPWLRDCIPLCKIDNNLASVGDWCFSQDFAAEMSASGGRLHWYPRNPLLQYIHCQQHADKP